MFGPVEGTRTVDAATLTATTPETWCRCGRHLVEPHKALCPTCADDVEAYAEMRRHDRMEGCNLALDIHQGQTAENWFRSGQEPTCSHMQSDCRGQQ